VEIENNRSRKERRAITVRSISAEQLGLPHAMQLAKLERTVTHRNGKRTHEVVWLVTSLSADQAGSEQLLQLIRAYWEIETGVHQRLDVGLKEDQCRIRDTQAGWALGWMRRIVIAQYYQWKAKIKRPREATSTRFLKHNARRITKLINLLTSPL
jgi:predicted transposase YbfD/YdcC